MIYGIVIAIASDMAWDIIGTRLYVWVLAFPYRMVHKSRVDQALCHICERSHKKHCKH